MSSTKNARPVIAEGLFSFDIGGSERVGADLAIEFAGRGYEVVCFAFYGSDGPIRTELESRGIRCVNLNYLSRLRYLRRITYQVEFYRFLQRNRVNALHVHHATALVLCGLPAKAAGVDHVVMTEHALHQLKERPRYLKEATRYCRYASQITAVHAGIADFFEASMQVERQRLHVIANGVRVGTRNSDLRRRIRQDLAVPDSCFMFLFAGRLEAVKDVRTLLEAIELLRADLSDRVRLVIAGDGSQRCSLEDYSREAGLTNTVQFLGSRTDVRDLMAAADCFVMTSVTEGLPMALIEAMATELPCVATAVGGIPELFSDECGMLTPPKNPTAIAATLRQVMDNADLRSRLTANAARKVEGNYNLEDVVTRYLALLGLPSHWPHHEH